MRRKAEFIALGDTKWTDWFIIKRRITSRIALGDTEWTDWFIALGGTEWTDWFTALGGTEWTDWFIALGGTEWTGWFIALGGTEWTGWFIIKRRITSRITLDGEKPKAGREYSGSDINKSQGKKAATQGADAMRRKAEPCAVWMRLFAVARACPSWRRLCEVDHS